MAHVNVTHMAGQPKGLARAIVVPKRLLFERAEVQRLALFFDNLVLYPLGMNVSRQQDRTRWTQEMRMLRDAGVVCHIRIDSTDEVRQLSGVPNATVIEDDPHPSDIRVTMPIFLAMISRPPLLDNEANLVRRLAGGLVYRGSSVAGWAASDLPDAVVGGAEVINAAIKQVTIPPPGLPWTEIIAFRNDQESRESFLRLRRWLNRQALSPTAPAQLGEELRELLDQHRVLMETHFKKVRTATIYATLAAATDVLLHWATGTPPLASLQGLFSIRNARVDLEGAELGSPGREVAYVASAQDLIDKKPKRPK